MSLKIGIVGARGLSTIKGFQAIKETRVQALCDLNQDLLEEQAQKHDIPQKYRVYDDMLETDIDAVVIATPMHLHVPQVLKALEAGKHVLSEVTAGVTMEELWWLKEWVEKYEDLVYMMAENYCYIPENQLIKNMVREGLFGEIYFGEGEYIHEIKKLTT
ncbi:MAG: Gfo/Idh/MocA family protein, partial [bacterium]